MGAKSKLSISELRQVVLSSCNSFATLRSKISKSTGFSRKSVTGIPVTKQSIVY